MCTKVFACGRNNHGQLGLDCAHASTSCMVQVHGDVAAMQVTCGYYHTVILSPDRQVYSFGRNNYGQLGLGNIKDCVFGLKSVVDGASLEIEIVSAGCYHTVLVGTSGMIHVFGRNNHGQLGTGDLVDRHSPHSIDLFLGKQVLMVAAGFYHTLLLIGQSQDEYNSPARAFEYPTYSASSILAQSHLVQITQDCTRTALDDAEVAAFILAHLDLRASIPGALEISHASAASEQPPETFQLLLGLLVWLYGVSNSASQLGNKRQLSIQEAPYMFIATLRILRATIEVFVQSRQAQSSLDRRNLDGFRLHQPRADDYARWVKNANAASQQDRISMPHAALYDCCKSNLYDFGVTLGGKIARDNRKLACGSSQQARLSEVVCCLQHQILILLQSPFDFEMGVSNIQRESAGVLIEGLDVFYPCWDSQIRLISELLVVHDFSVVYSSKHGSVPLSGKRAARHLLLNQLLERFSKDAIASCFVRSAAFDVDIRMSGASRENEFHRIHPLSNSAKTLLGLSRLLIKHLAFHDLGKFDLTEGTDVQVHALLKSAMLAIQKHLFYWAARSAEVFVPPIPEGSMSILHFACASLFSRAQASEGLQCLRCFCRLVLTQSCTFFHKNPIPLPGPLSLFEKLDMSQTNSVDSHLDMHILPFQCVALVHNSSVGILLRHVLNGLLAFAQRPTVANDLLGPITCLSQLLNASWQRSPDSISYSNNDSNSGQSRSWFEDLASTAAMLAGSLAAALMSHQVPQHVSHHPAVASLLRGGFKSNWMCVLIQQRILPSTMLAVNSEATKHTSVRGKAHVPCIYLNSTKEKITDSFIAGDGIGHRFCRWLRKSYCNFDPSYFVLTKQAIKRGLYPTIWDIERAIAVLLFKHNYCEAQLCLYASRSCNIVTLRAAPRRFLFLWSGVARITTWLWHHKSALCASQSNGCDRFLFANALAHVLVLLSFRSPEHAFGALTEAPLKFSIYHAPPNTGADLSRGVCVKWRRAIAQIRATIRWRHSCAKKIRVFVFMRTDSNFSLRVVQHLQTSLASANSPGIVQDAVNTYHCTAMRRDGTLALSALASSLTMPRLLISSLYSLSDLFKKPNSLNLPVRSFDATVLSCRESLYRVCADLWCQLCILMQHRVDNVRKGSPSSLEIHLILLLIAAFGQASTFTDLNHLSDIKVIHVLHNLLLSLNDAGSRLKSADEHVFPNSLDVSHAKKYVQRSFHAVWALLRNFGASYTWSAAMLEEEGGVECPSEHPFIQARTEVTAGLFRVYKDVGWRSLAKLQAANVIDLKLNGSTTSQLDSNLSVMTSHSRRCQEMISTPMRLVSPDSGIRIGSENIITNPRGSDLSFTLWLYVLQNPTGYDRAVLLRGTRTTCRPILLIRDNDMRLEVRFTSSSSFEMERFTSKDRIPLSQWVHIGIVVEGIKVRLYLNGMLDNQHMCSSKIPETELLPVYIGCLPHATGCTFEGITGSVDGYIARLRFYTRALSPIHLRIVCDQGPPGTFQAGDCWCYQLSAVLLTSANALLCRLLMCDLAWFDLFLAMINRGTPRIQQAAVRTLRMIMQDVEPAKLDTSIAQPTPSLSMLEELFRLVGRSLFQNGKYQREACVTKVCHDDSDALLGSPLVATEVITLFRFLWTNPRWDSRILFMIQTTLSKCNHGSCGKNLNSSAQIAALSVLGGHSHGIDSGAVISLLSTGSGATVVDYDHLTCRALIANCGDYTFPVRLRPPSPLPSPIKSLRPLHIKADKLMVQLTKPSIHQGWTMNLLERCVSPQAGLILSVSLHILQSFAQQEYDKCAKDCWDILGEAQRCTRCIKVLYAISLHPKLLEKETNWPGMISMLMRLSAKVGVSSDK